MTGILTYYHVLVLPTVTCCQNYPLTILLTLHGHKKQLLLVQPQKLKRQPLECTNQNQTCKNLIKRTAEYIKESLICCETDTVSRYNLLVSTSPLYAFVSKVW